MTESKHTYPNGGRRLIRQGVGSGARNCWRLTIGLLVAVAAVGCSSDSSDLKAVTTSTTSAKPAPSSAPTSSPPTSSATTATSASPGSGSTPGLDDYNGDGDKDPTCGTQDFGAGLVLRIPCRDLGSHEPAEGTTLVAKSLFRLPGENRDEFTGASADLLEARDAAGKKTKILVFNTSGLFDTGSAVILNPDTFDACVRGINADFPDGVVQVRGHTDSKGSASNNQALSQKRAASVAAYLQSHGLHAASITAAGLGSTQPLAEEHNAVDDQGMRFNRRVEIVVREGSTPWPT